MAEEKTDQLQLENVRLSFPDIWEPKAINQGDTPKYGAALLLDKKEHAETIKAIKVLMWAMAVAEFGGSEKAKDLVKKNKLHFALHEGSEKDYAGYDESNQYLSTSSTRRPTVIARDMTPLTKDDGRPYAGCYVNAVVRFWVQKNEFGKRVNCELLGLQFVKDGEAFGAPPFNAEDHFKNLDEGKAAGKKAAKTADGAAPDDDEIPF